MNSFPVKINSYNKKKANGRKKKKEYHTDSNRDFSFKQVTQMYALKFRSPKENHLADLIHLNDLYNSLHTLYDPMPDCTYI